MKKRICTLILLMTFLFTACGGVHSGWKISCSDGEETLDIPLFSKVSYNMDVTFYTKYDFDELVEKIREKVSPFGVQVYQESYMTICAETTFFLIEKAKNYGRNAEGLYRYYFFCPKDSFEFGEMIRLSENDYSQYAKLYMPYHLLSDVYRPHRDTSFDNIFPQTIECEALGTVEEFYDFYDHIAHCEVTREGDTLRVSHRDGGTLLLTFVERDGKAFVIFETVASAPW